MKRLFLPLLLSGTALAFDFTPQTKELLLDDGATIRRNYFKNGEQLYSFRLDEQIALTGNRNRATFQFQNLQGATMVLTRSPFTPDTPFTGEHLRSYREAAATFAPSGAMEIVEETDGEGLLKINDWHSHRWLFTYRLPGGNIRQSVTFLNITPKEQIAVVVTAFSVDFKEAEAAALGVLHSWHLLTPNELMKPSDN